MNRTPGDLPLDEQSHSDLLDVFCRYTLLLCVIYTYLSLLLLLLVGFNL